MTLGDIYREVIQRPRKRWLPSDLTWWIGYHYPEFYYSRAWAAARIIKGWIDSGYTPAG